MGFGYRISYSHFAINSSSINFVITIADAIYKQLGEYLQYF